MQPPPSHIGYDRPWFEHRHSISLRYLAPANLFHGRGQTADEQQHTHVHRAHILEGLRIALDHIDRIIAIIRGSSTDEEALNSLMSEFSLSERQGKAILEMRLRRLTGLERGKIEEEYQGS